MHVVPWKTGFIGFAASIGSITQLYRDLVASPCAPLTCTLRDKFSQDHLDRSKDDETSNELHTVCKGI